MVGLQTRLDQWEMKTRTKLLASDQRDLADRVLESGPR